MKTNDSVSAFAVALLALMAVTPQIAAAQTGDSAPTPVLTEFDEPDAAVKVSPACGYYCGTYPTADNNSGSVTGFYTDKYVVPHGFIRTPEGKFLSFNAPGADLTPYRNRGTTPYAINDTGVVAGQYDDKSNIFHGFIRNADGSFVTFETPDAGTAPTTGTYAFDINATGATAGVYYDNSGLAHGFVRSAGGDIVEFDPAESAYTFVCQETCLSENGTVVGYYYDSNNVVHGFSRAPNGNIETIDAPEAGTVGNSGTVAASINSAGEIVGYVIDDNSVAHGFVRHADGSFGLDFNIPGANSNPGGGTAAFAVDLPGATTGVYLDANFAEHGFARTAQGSVARITAPDAGVAQGEGTRPTTINNSGEVTGYFVDGTNLNHGFVWTP